MDASDEPRTTRQILGPALHSPLHCQSQSMQHFPAMLLLTHLPQETHNLVTSSQLAKCGTCNSRGAGVEQAYEYAYGVRCSAYGVRRTVFHKIKIPYYYRDEKNPHFWTRGIQCLKAGKSCQWVNLVRWMDVDCTKTKLSTFSKSCDHSVTKVHPVRKRSGNASAVRANITEGPHHKRRAQHVNRSNNKTEILDLARERGVSPCLIGNYWESVHSQHILSDSLTCTLH
jgi:hypothetical protein